VLAGDVSVVAARRRRRRAAVLHSHRRRVRNSRSPGRLRQPDDRADAVAGILHQQGLAGGFRDRRGAACPAAGAAPHLRPAAAPPAGGALMATGLKKLSPFNVTALVLGLAFLYLPIVILVIYSFNASRLVTVWGGWSTRWY